jgi:poly(A) polymerase
MAFPTPDLRIDPPEWMTAPETAAVMAALGGPGATPTTLFVGGCVRNTLAGRPVDDIDLASVLTPEEVLKRLEAARLRGVPTGLAHGTVTAVSGGRGFEVTTLRRDLETDGRRAVVGFTDDWVQDAQRRDFTMNTLLAAPDGSVYDPLGRGLADLRARRVVFVGDPDRRIAEDRLRVLRFFRFHGAYADGPPDEAALSACARAAGDLSSLSRERITQEFMKILSGRDPARVLELMAGCGVVPELCAGPSARRILSSLCALQAANDAPEDPSARLAALAETDPARLERLADSLVLPNARRDRARALCAASGDVPADPDSSVLPLLYRHGLEASVQAVLLALASGRVPAAALRLLPRLRAAPRPVFPVSGADLIALGVSAGPRMGAILADLERWWLEQNCAPNRTALLARVQK